MRCVLGLDSGGSKCDALVATEDGVVIGWGHVDVLDPRSGRDDRGGSGRSRRTVRQAAQDALRDITCDELHVTCLGGAVPLGFWRRADVGRVLLHPAAEHNAAFTLVGERCGVVALAGTGAFAYGRTRDGRDLHLDGLGPLLGDYGSGYHIGSMAIRAAAKSRWHPRWKTALEETVTDAIGGTWRPGTRDSSLVEFMLGPRDRA